MGLCELNNVQAPRFIKDLVTETTWTCYKLLALKWTTTMNVTAWNYFKQSDKNVKLYFKYQGEKRSGQRVEGNMTLMI